MLGQHLGPKFNIYSSTALQISAVGATISRKRKNMLNLIMGYGPFPKSLGGKKKRYNTINLFQWIVFSLQG
jgi:hypothetical protein